MKWRNMAVSLVTAAHPSIRRANIAGSFCVKMKPMKAMQIHQIAALADNPEPLLVSELPVPDPGAGELRIKVTVCGVCHTELDECEGRTPPSS
jgi:D-arabinose 1-dehydrogenase-like Zn-dependent alcohol dehydrogenase